MTSTLKKLDLIFNDMKDLLDCCLTTDDDFKNVYSGYYIGHALAIMENLQEEIKNNYDQNQLHGC